MRKISIIYDGKKHVGKAAQLLAEAFENGGANTTATDVLNLDYELVNNADTIVFGSASSFGTVSATFKAFMESTESFWYRQPWKNKFAAAFTVSCCNSADKLNTLQTLSLFGAYHGMQWISLGILPRFVSGQQSDGQNRFSCYSGLMLQAMDNSEDAEFHTGDLLTLELFVKRILEINLNKL